MVITRRSFLRYCGMSAAALGLNGVDLLKLEEALASVTAPPVLWLQGAACAGCSVSLLNRISTTAPTTVDQLLINNVNLIYHPTLSAAQGPQAVAAIEATMNQGGYILVIEGGVPTAFGGSACIAWAKNGVPVTFADAVRNTAASAKSIVCVGTCSSFGGLPAAGGNPTGIRSVSSFLGRSTINIPGCPPHPDWMIGTLVNLILGKSVPLDGYRRPTSIYGRKLHESCPYKGTGEAKTYGGTPRCLKELGCRGPETYCNCHVTRWNNKVNWCVQSGAPCNGCTEPTFGTRSLFKFPSA